ncbi:hypothetical protein FACS1894151_03170 [Spirochaetia bacterium]|nr:hypothetical protein FACS1894151_03170 [Spirochaetia bacterium]
MIHKLDIRRFVFVLLLCIGVFRPGSILFALSEFFWEDPAVFSPAAGVFPVTAYNDAFAVIGWQETENSSNGGSIYLSIAVQESGGDWAIRRRVAGPYMFSGTEPSILSMIIDKEGRIVIAAAASTTETEILVSSDRGRSFEKGRIGNGSETSVAPRIYSSAAGGYILFITRGGDQSLNLYYSFTDDPFTWPEFEPFVTESGMDLNFLPSHVSMGAGDYVVFQSYVGAADAAPSFQLFLKSSFDGGDTWSEAKHITTFRDSRMNTEAAPDRFDNQRPDLSVQDGNLFLVWERHYITGSPQIYAVTMDFTGNVIGFVDRVNTDEAYCNYPIAFSYEGETTVVWFDNRRGNNRVFLAQRAGLDWQNFELSGSGGEAVFARPVIVRQELILFYQALSRGMNRIFTLIPDSSVNPPRFSSLNFTPGERSRGERVRIAWDVPVDPSGIIGFSYIWSQDPYEVPPRDIVTYTGISSLERIADDDGSWYFSIIAQDFAGNWSAPSQIEYIRDTTPPPAAAVIMPPVNEQSYLLTNTFQVRWNQPPASDIAGYTWNLEFLGPLDSFDFRYDPLVILASLDQGDEDAEAEIEEEIEEKDSFALAMEAFQGAASSYFPSAPVLPQRMLGVQNSVSFSNEDNGIYRFTVAAIDQVGNIGRPSSVFFRNSRFIPYTMISLIDAFQDDQGILTVRIIGKGFTDEGNITRIIIDRDGIPPYDREYYLNRRDFRILSDREITGILIDDIEEGRYRVGLEHQRRGFTWSEPRITVDERGTVKFGDYSRAWEPSWALRNERRYVLDTPFLVVIILLIFSVLGMFVSLRGIGNVLAESAAIKVDAVALITGDFMPSEKKQRLKRIKRRGLGLRFKLASFTIVLVLFIVVMVSAPLYLMMTQTQRDTLFSGLWDRSTVLLEGLASSARAYLPSGNVLELGFLPAQSSGIPEARYVTITGFGNSSTIFDDHVWASNDPDILSKIDTEEFEPGISRLVSDSLSPRLEGIATELNEEARARVGDLNESIANFTAEGLMLALRTDQASINRLNDVQVTIRAFETRLNEALTGIGREIGSEPLFSIEDNDTSLYSLFSAWAESIINSIKSGDTGSAEENTSFIFFKPVLYRQGSEDTYFRGLIRLEVSTESILEAISQGRGDLLQVILLVALSAIVIGVIGALGLSTIIIRPIQKLVSHVELIRDTEDKSKLEGVDINIKSKDELAVLGATINDMTHGLVKAAQAASDLTIGKEVQKKFIPLEVDREGNKLTSGSKDAKFVNFFGYYEGAKGVSGDYFDYQELDGRYYAIIKCDVAGKGIPAALIMIQVATMFLNYFKAWKPTAKGMHIEEVVYQINDFIEALGFRGRFAAFTLCLFDSQTGVVRFCNAGDNIVHFYDASEHKMKTLTLPETPATGVLPSFLVETKGGYQVQTVTLDHGDILFLYTDGIEEAKRKFRDTKFKEIICTEGEKDTPHENHTVGQGDEEMGPDRVVGIINAVLNKQIFTLHKYHNPEGEDNDLQFDFTNCNGTVEEAIMAMVSVEKMFRLYKALHLGDDSRVLVDQKVDAFLKEHFMQYRTYCSNTREFTGTGMYTYYTHVAEDPQYDDLTIIGINRK